MRQWSVFVSRALAASALTFGFVGPAAAQGQDQQPPVPGGIERRETTPEGGRVSAPLGTDWRTWVNAWRDAAHLPPVTEIRLVERW